MTALLVLSALSTVAVGGGVAMVLRPPPHRDRPTDCPLHGILSFDRVVRTPDGQRHCAGCYADALRDAPTTR